VAYSQEQARDERGRFASGGQGQSQARAERVALNQRLDARNRSLTYGFGPKARTMENKEALAAHTSGIESAVNGKTLAQLSAEGTNPAIPPPKIGGAS
jgi:hypothetical protein